MAKFTSNAAVPPLRVTVKVATLRAAVALADRDVVDRDRARNRCDIIVGDGADTLTVADGGAVGRI